MKNKINILLESIKKDFVSEGIRHLNIPIIRRPDDDKIRDYAEKHKDKLSLIDFAEWVIQNSRR